MRRTTAVSSSRLATVFLLLEVVVTSGCLSTRNFQAPQTRMLESTAYTLTKHQAEFGISALRTRPSELGAYLGAQYGFSDRVMGGINLAHAANGLIGTNWKWNFFQTEGLALAAAAGATWIHGSWLWALPASLRDPVSNVNAISVPLDLLSSYTPAHWVQFNLGLGYNFSQVFGPINTASTDVNLGVGVRNLHIDPSVYFYVARTVAFFVSGDISVWAQAPMTVTAESDLGNGTRVGVRSGELVQLSPSKLSRGSAAFEISFSRSAYLRAGIASGGLSRELAGIDILPFVGFYWRTMP